MNRKKLALAAAAVFIMSVFGGCVSGEKEEAQASSDALQTTPVAEAAADNTTAAQSDTYDLTFTDNDMDGQWDGTYDTAVALNGDSGEVTGSGAVFDGSTVTISEAGTYLFTGTLLDGQIVISAGDTDKIWLIFDGVTLNCSDSAALLVEQADKVFVTLAENSENSVATGDDYSDEAVSGEVTGAIFSRDDLCLNGNGMLTVTTGYKHGIVSKDDLVITGGTYSIASVSDGLRGRNCVKIADGDFTINAGTDGIQSSNADEAGRGYVYIQGGTFNITASCDGIQAETYLCVAGGNLVVNTGGGSENASMLESGKANPDWGIWGQNASAESGGAGINEEDDSTSAKGLKAGLSLEIFGGDIGLNSSDDSVHSNGDATVYGGNISISSGDDGMHSDSTLTISGGTVNISESYEGLEGSTVNISGGDITVAASDDGINAAGGNDASSVDGRPGENMFSEADGSSINISGGYILIDADGDGVDSNGNIEVSGGVTLVNGPTDDGNGALDYAGSMNVTGGVFMAAGSSGMAMGASETSTQGCICYTFAEYQSQETRVTVRSDDGSVICTFVPSKSYSNIFATASGIAQGGTYLIDTGGTVSNADANGYADSGALSGGETQESINMDSVTYSNGSGKMEAWPGQKGEVPEQNGIMPGGQ